MSRILVISTSLREGSNSELLARRAAAGARDAGHAAELLSLKGKKIGFCLGCMACQETRKCVQPDDAAGIAARVFRAETLVFATPVYYSGMSGQMKTLLDRLEPLYGAGARFRRVYLLCTAADLAQSTPEKAVLGLRGWVDAFPPAEFAGTLFCGGLAGPGAAAADPDALARAYAFGRSLS